MDKVPLVTLIFYSIPESFLILSMGLIIQRKTFRFASLSLAIIISVSASYFARLLPLPYGIHTLLGVLTVFLLFFLLLGMSPKQSLVSAIIGIGTLAALENVISSLIQFKLGLGLKDILALSPWQRTIIGWPHLIIWGGINLYLYKKLKPIQDVKR